MTDEHKLNFTLTPDEIDDLVKLSRSRSAPAGKVERARILLAHIEGVSIAELARQLNTDRSKIYRCIKKAQIFGARESLEDRARPLRKPTITAQAKDWLIAIAQRNPEEFRLPCPRWTQELLAAHARATCAQAGHPSLRRVQKSTVNKILAERGITSNRQGFYLERREQQAAQPVHEVLCIYHQINLLTRRGQAADTKPAIVLSSCEEAVGAHENSNTQHWHVGQGETQTNDDFISQGASSLLAGIDLANGHVHGLLSNRCRSKDFVAFLKTVHNYYPRETLIRIILNDHTSHTSKEAEKFLAKVTNRFEIVSTPKNSSWHRLVHTFFRPEPAGSDELADSHDRTDTEGGDVWRNR
jgi:transposase